MMQPSPTETKMRSGASQPQLLANLEDAVFLPSVMYGL